MIVVPREVRILVNFDVLCCCPHFKWGATFRAPQGLPGCFKPGVEASLGLKRLLSTSSEFTLSTLVKAHRQPLNFSRAGERSLVRHRDGPDLRVSRFTDPSRYLSCLADRVYIGD